MEKSGDLTSGEK